MLLIYFLEFTLISAGYYAKSVHDVGYFVIDHGVMKLMFIV